MSAVLVPVCLLAAWHDVPEVGRRAAELLRAHAGARDVHGRRLRRDRRLPVLRLLRGDARSRSTSSSGLRRRAPAVRRGEVPAVLARRRAGHARRRHRAVLRRAPAAPTASCSPTSLGLQHRTRPPSGCCSSASSSPSRSRRRCVPVHTWLPDAAAEARPATAVLLVGVLDKVGTFGMIRFCLPLFPEAAKWATPGGHRAGGHLDPLRRAAGHRPDRHHAADRATPRSATSASSCWASSR